MNNFFELLIPLLLPKKAILTSDNKVLSRLADFIKLRYFS